MPNPDFTAELSSIPYEHIIGEPLRAAVDANTKASQTAAEYILELGFTEPVVGNQEPVMVDFTYTKRVIDEASGEEVSEEHIMSVPLLLLLHIPYFEVENVTIDFNVKLNSVDTFGVSSQLEYETGRGRGVRSREGYGRENQDDGERGVSGVDSPRPGDQTII